MAENTTTNTGTPGNQGGEGSGNNNNATSTPIDFSKVDDGTFAKVFEDKRVWDHPRFKELTTAAQELKQIKEKQKADEENTLKEQNKWKELAEAKDQEIGTLKNQVQQSVVNNQLLMAFQKVGFIDADAALKLVDRANIKVNEDGTVTGVTEAVEQLKTKSPYLVGKPGAVTVGSSSGNPSDQNQGTPRFKHSQIKDPVFYREHEAEIMQAMKLGTIEND